jgi:hypothetical protein
VSILLQDGRPFFLLRNDGPFRFVYRRMKGGQISVNDTLPRGHISNLRRSQRLSLAFEVVVTARGENGRVSSEETKTLVISSRGALLLLHTGVAIGEVLTIRNVQTQEEVPCRVSDLESSSQPGMMEVGIEFIKNAPSFWRVSFPPGDWTLRSPEAKGFRPQIAASVVPVGAKKTNR